MRLVPPVILLIVITLACGQPAHSATSPSAALNTQVGEIKEGQVIDGVPCLTEDLPARHIHVHLAIFLDGAPVKVPAGIGVGRPWGVDQTGFIATGSCFAWIHTHDTTGVIHIFTDPQESFTLGQLFEVWGRPIDGGGALGYRGREALLVDGQPFGADPRSLVLTSFENIVLELGRPPSNLPPAFDFGSLKA